MLYWAENEHGRFGLEVSMKYHAVIFDLDGTLLDTLEDLTEAANAALVKNGMPERTIGQVREFVGNGIAKLIERAVPDGTDESAAARVLADFRIYYKEHCRDNTAPYEGVVELLGRLRGAGLKLAVVSNKAEFAVKELVPVYFGDRITVAHGEDEAAGVRKKPAPDMVELALSECGCPSERAVYVGDSDVDIETAANAGMDCISVTWGFRRREWLLAHGAEVLAETPEELYNKIVEKNQ